MGLFGLEGGLEGGVAGGGGEASEGGAAGERVADGTIGEFGRGLGGGGAQDEDEGVFAVGAMDFADAGQGEQYLEKGMPVGALGETRKQEFRVH